MIKVFQIFESVIVNPKYDPYNKEETSDYLIMAKVSGELRQFKEKVYKNFIEYKSDIISGIQKLVPFCKVLDVEIYGSISKNEHKEGSDIDLLVTVTNIKKDYTDLDVQDDLYGKIGIPNINGACDISVIEI